MKTKMLWFIFLIVPNILCLAAELTKTDLSVAYWYYSYYEPERIEKPPFKWETPDTLSPVTFDSLTKNSNLYGPDSTTSDSTALEFEKTKSKPDQYGKIAYMIMPAYNAVFMQDSIPYIKVEICYTGDEKDLQAIGVLIIIPIDTANCRNAVFPLSLLPQVDAIEGVTRIAEFHDHYFSY